MSTKTLISNNIALKYDSDSWNEKESKVKNILESLSIALSVMLSITLLVVIMRAGISSSWGGLFAYIGILVMMTSMILLIALVEKLIYGKTITGYRFIDWFTKAKNPEAVCEHLNGEIIIKPQDERLAESWKLRHLLRDLGCNCSIEYKDMYTIKKSDKVNVEIDATDKEVVKVYIEKA